MCKGLCTVSMASLIENCKRVPNRKLMEALFSRLGEKAPSNKVIMRKSDFHMRNLEYRLERMIANSNYDTKKLLESYKNTKESLNNLELQFYELHLSHYINRECDQYEQAMQKLCTALRRTIPEYELNSPVSQKLFTRTEILILNNIARCQYELGKKDEALAMMEFLKNFLNSGIVGNREKSMHLPMVVFNIANWMGDKGKVKEALQMTNIGLEICKKYGRLPYFPYHIFNKGYCYAQLGEKEKAKSFFSNSFTIFDIMGKHDDTVYASPIINKQFGYDFPTD